MLAFSQKGEGETVVFLHGFLESSSMWKGLDFPFHCIFIDLPGHGYSQNLVDPQPSIKYFAEEVLKVLDHLNCTQYSIVGHSMGGYVALELLRQSERVQKVILLNSNFWEDTSKKKLDRNRIVEIVAKNKEWFIREAIPNLFYHPVSHQELIDSLCIDASKMSVESIQLATIAMRDRSSFEDIIVANSDKVKILQGIHDNVVPLETMVEMNNSRCDLIVLKDSAHMSHAEVPESVVSTIIFFLNQE